MFIFKLTYQQPLTIVEQHLSAHRTYLDKYYQLGHFIASGRQEPRIGGIILCRAENREHALNIMHEDPFYVHHIAQYEIIEFIPTKHAQAFEVFL